MTRDDGQKLHNTFRPILDAGETVTLDFAGTRVFVSAFFNAAIGQLLRDYTREQLRERLKFVNVPDAAVAPLKRSIENAERYYGNPQYRAAIDAVLEQHAAEA